MASYRRYCGELRRRLAVDKTARSQQQLGVVLSVYAVKRKPSFLSTSVSSAILTVAYRLVVRCPYLLYPCIITPRYSNMYLTLIPCNIPPNHKCGPKGNNTPLCFLFSLMNFPSCLVLSFFAFFFAFFFLAVCLPYTIGSFGKVYKAWDTHNSIYVALKVRERAGQMR